MLGNSCPWCGDSLLRHVCQGRIYWFCTGCRAKISANLLSQIKASAVSVELSHSSTQTLIPARKQVTDDIPNDSVECQRLSAVATMPREPISLKGNN